MTLLTLAMLAPVSFSGVQPLPRDAGGRGARVAVDHVAVLDQRLAAAPQPLEGHALLDPPVRKLVARRVVPEEDVPPLDRLRVQLLAVEALPDPVLRVVGEVGTRVALDVGGKALYREIVVSAGEVGVGLAVELARSGHRRRSGGAGVTAGSGVGR